ncbi:hypothetical protein KIN20_016271 [Parelaphostrongylus tenuis]|uniref:Uncharacterized protein n=1 Tax=Parelaphostrongylus tenuis TaxID=148309 RepID=A0AAD5QQL3_PARTN|nr:hypothetical protein KIN20_016271 [Parelaphostrongylus tenuis]
MWLNAYGVLTKIRTGPLMHQPNIYLCKKESRCCFYNGRPACCLSNISLHNLILQSYPIALPFVVFLLLAAIVQWLLSVDEPPVEVQEKNFQKKTLIELLCPIDVKDDVNDPLFGEPVEENMPRRAYVERGGVQSPNSYEEANVDQHDTRIIHRTYREHNTT